MYGGFDAVRADESARPSSAGTEEIWDEDQKLFLVPTDDQAGRLGVLLEWSSVEKTPTLLIVIIISVSQYSLRHYQSSVD